MMLDLHWLTKDEAAMLDRSVGELLAGATRSVRIRSDRLRVDMSLQPPVVPVRTDPRQLPLF